MRIAFTLIVCALACPVNATPIPGAASQPIRYEVTRDDPSGATVSLDFPTPTIRMSALEAGGSSLIAEIDGIVPDFDAAPIALPELTRLIAVSPGYRVEADCRVISERVIEVAPIIARDELNGRSLRSLETHPTVEVGEPVWIRYMRVAPVAIRPVQYDYAHHQLIAVERVEISFSFVPDDRDDAAIQPDVNRYWSLAFDDFFKATLLNPAALPAIPANGREITRGTYLILTTPALVRATEQFADWKRQKGFNVVVDSIARNDITADSIRNYIRDAYDTWPRPPEFILMLGDVNRGDARLPSNLVRSLNGKGNDQTDLPYVLLQGDDYFPDAFIGRLAVDSPSLEEALTALRRMVKYEQDSTGAPRENFHRATVIGSNYTNDVPSASPVMTIEWLAGMLQNRGWRVDSFYWRRAGDNEDPTPVIESINQGVNLVAYRGSGDVNGINRPRLSTAYIDNLTNGPLLPMMTFYSCHSADFGNRNSDRSIGDAAVTAGSRIMPAGAIGWIGPTDLNTEARVNNAMIAGWYSGILFENQRNVSALLLRSKLEAWTQLPLERTDGDPMERVPFYFRVYHLLGDPDLDYFFDPPIQLNVSAPQELSVGDTEARFVVRTDAGESVEGALIHISGQNTDYTILTDISGVALASLRLPVADTLEATVIGRQLSPWIGTIPVTGAVRMISVERYTVGGVNGAALTPGRRSVEISLKNLGRAVEDALNIRVESLDGYCGVENPAFEVASIDPGAVVELTGLFVEVAPACPNKRMITLKVIVTYGAGQNRISTEHLIRIPVSNLQLRIAQINRVRGTMQPGETSDVLVALQNDGAPSGDLRGVVSSFDNSVEIEQGDITFRPIARGESRVSSDTLRIHVKNGVAIGRQVQLRLTLFNDADVRCSFLQFPMTVGNPGPRDPLGPESYGYSAYENTDQHPLAPTYEWIELDPAYGGSGARLDTLSDDETVRMRLPFRFKFYGVEYENVSICSNGWLSFDTTAGTDFINQSLPSPLGPRSMICPYWEDLIGDRYGAPRDSLRILTRYDERDGRFVIEWSRLLARGENGNERQTFEVVLSDPSIYQTPTGDGEILFQYLETLLVSQPDDANFASIGIEDWDHQRGLEIGYSNLKLAAIDTLIGGRAIRITTMRPDSFLVADRIRPAAPFELALHSPSPNPFNSTTLISFSTPSTTRTRLAVFDLTGRLVQNLVDDNLQAGAHRVVWDANNLTAGVYLIRLEAAHTSLSRKVVLIR